VTRILHFQSKSSIEDTITFALNGKIDDFITITISQEQAVDSYNATFDNDYTLNAFEIIPVKE
jgi:hypothetical protein